MPGDKSISHRALIMGATAVGTTLVHGLLDGDDVRRTAAALRALGIEIARGEDGVWRVEGRGVGGLAAPAEVLDMGNAGTGARLLCGLLASHPFTAFLTGDASLCRRPMGRIITPLERMGARFLARDGGRLPLAVSGARDAMPIDYRLPVPSAQVKSAILLAGLNAPGQTRIVEPVPTRDHTETLMRHFGVAITVTDDAESGARTVTLEGQPEITGREIVVPADPSSAAFPLVAALLVPGSRITVTGVGVNPTRAGLFECLAEMGAALAFDNRRRVAGEPVADITATAGPLAGIRVAAARAPSMIDEYPILAVAAACARGTTRLEGLAELRVKESDRLAAIADGLALCGVAVEAGPDSLTVHGADGPPPGADPEAVVATHGDHRIAMAFLVLGLAAARPVGIDDGAMIDTSFPGFVTLMNGLGATIVGAEVRE